ncbi:MAG: TonB family protein [Bacteroidetes bacterium]|jgi:TonB family protein|nr:TonB family protein [Bacteroidota bacterium]
MYTTRILSSVALFCAIFFSGNINAQSTELSVAGSSDNLYFLPVEEEPSYKGDPDSLVHFISSGIAYPQDAIDKNVSGTVYVSFVILENGELSDVKVFKGIGSGCDEEAVRVIKMTSGRWLPGRQKGKTVKVFYNLPVRFSLT